jgi:hypothetical protein
VYGALIFVMGEGAVRFGPFSFGDFQLVTKANGREAEKFVVAFDAAFNLGFQIV